MGGGSARAKALADQFLAAAERLIGTIEKIDSEQWDRVREADEWSPGKDAEHAADAAALHLFHIGLSLGIAEPDPPAIERKRLTALRSQREVLEALRRIAIRGTARIEGLTDAQLELPAKPPRQPPRTVADVIARPLTKHLGTHTEVIEKKLRARPT